MAAEIFTEDEGVPWARAGVKTGPRPRGCSSAGPGRRRGLHEATRRSSPPSALGYHAPPMSGPSPTRSRSSAAFALAALAVALVPRLVTWASVFTAGGVRFVGDGDPYYHVRRAGLILDAGAIVWRDPWLNYPAGADIPWPPLFDLLVAGAAWLAGLGRPAPETLAAVAAVVPVVIGVLSIWVAALLAAELFGAAVGAVTAILLALSQSHAYYGLLGRPDQHVLEVLLFCAVTLAFARGLRGARLRTGPVLLLGVTLALSFWNWLGSALTLLALGVACVVAGVVVDPARPDWGRPARLLAAGSAAAASLLALSIGVAGPRGALLTFSLGGLSAFQVALPAATAVLAASLLVPRVRSRAARAAALVVLPSALLGLGLLVPALRAPVERGLAAAAQSNAWYGSIVEFMPMLFSGLRPVEAEVRALLQVFGLVPILAGVGAAVAWRRAAADPAAAQATVLALTLAALFGVATLRMTRFMVYGAVPLALLAAVALVELRRRVDALRPRAGLAAATVAAAVALAPTAPALARGERDLSAGGLERLLLRVHGSAERGDRRAMLTPWPYGHHALFLAGRPVIASPFGTEGGAGALEDLAAFYTEADPAAAERLLARRAVQYVLLRNPTEDVALLVGHGGRTGTGGVQARHHVALERIPSLVVTRLYGAAGSGSDDPAWPGLEGFRLVDEEDPDTVPVRLFEVVPGATVAVRGGTPGGRVTATVGLAAPFGGEGAWRTVRALDARGEAVLRLPYATGPNGRIIARAWVLTDGRRSAALALSEQQVTEGARVTVDLVPR